MTFMAGGLEQDSSAGPPSSVHLTPMGGKQTGSGRKYRLG